MKVEVRGNNVEQALKVFKRKIMKSGILKEMRLREAFEKPSAKRARKKKEAIKNWRKKRASMELKPFRRKRNW